MNKISITGANGFIGNFICKYLASRGKIVHGISRSKIKSSKNENIKYSIVGEINSNTNWKKLLIDCECVIHCAGKVHDSNKNELADYQSVNIDGTYQLALQASKLGVRRLIFLSSIKVNGENTSLGSPFSFNHDAKPKDSYGLSKYMAEKKLWEISAKSNLEVVIIRLPLVYGYGAKGNLFRLMKLINYGFPLPFKLIKNKRSLIGIDNLADVLFHCINHAEASGKTFLISDGVDLSTCQLIKYMATYMRIPVRFFPLPISILKIIGFIFGKSNEINKLIDSLQVDSHHARKILNWIPPVSVEEGIKRMVKGK